MLLEKATQLVSFVFAHPVVNDMANKGDRLSSHQTDHSMEHLLEVVTIAGQLSLMLQANLPGLISEWDRDVVIPLGALLHDIGRAIDVDDHARVGAKWSRDFLRELSLPGDSETLPRHTVNRIAKIVACHRSNVVLRREFDDVAWAVVVLADKFAGDEERVRPGRAAILSVLTFFRLSFIPLREGGVHDRANFAIKKSEPAIQNDELVLKLKLDPRVCKARLILDLYSDRYLACHRAASFLGLKFRIEVDSDYSHSAIERLKAFMSGSPCLRLLERFAYDEQGRRWVSEDSITGANTASVA